MGSGCGGGGLRWRLTAWVAVVMLLFAAVIFVAVYRGTATQLRHQIDTELAGDASELSHNLQLFGRGSPHTLAAAASRYVHDQPFGASSTLLFASVPGVGTSTNQPELLGQVAPDDGETRRRAGSGEPTGSPAVHGRRRLFHPGLPRCRRSAPAQAPPHDRRSPRRHDRRRRAAGSRPSRSARRRARVHARRARWRSPPRCWSPT